MKKKRIASFLLALVMALGLLPAGAVPAAAAESYIVFDEKTGLWLDVGSEVQQGFIKDFGWQYLQADILRPAFVVAPPDGEAPYSFEDLVIPKRVEGTDLFIVGIRDGAFTDCETLKTVTLTDGMMLIGYNSVSPVFKNCVNLVSVTGGRGLRGIQSGAFENCPKLELLELSTGVTLSLPDDAFVDGKPPEFRYLDAIKTQMTDTTGAAVEGGAITIYPYGETTPVDLNSALPLEGRYQAEITLPNDYILQGLYLLEYGESLPTEGFKLSLLYEGGRPYFSLEGLTRADLPVTVAAVVRRVSEEENADFSAGYVLALEDGKAGERCLMADQDGLVRSMAVNQDCRAGEIYHAQVLFQFEGGLRRNTYDLTGSFCRSFRELTFAPGAAEQWAWDATVPPAAGQRLEKVSLEDGDIVSYATGPGWVGVAAAWLVERAPEYVFVAGKSGAYTGAEGAEVVDYTLVHEDGSLEVVTSGSTRYNTKYVYAYGHDGDGELLLTLNDHTRQRRSVTLAESDRAEVNGGSRWTSDGGHAFAVDGNSKVWYVKTLVEQLSKSALPLLADGQDPAAVAASLPAVTVKTLAEKDYISYSCDSGDALRAAFIHGTQTWSEPKDGGGSTPECVCSWYTDEETGELITTCSDNPNCPAGHACCPELPVE